MLKKNYRKENRTREQLDAEIATKTRLFDEEIKARTQSLSEVEESIVKNQQIAQDTFNSLSKKLFQQKGELMSQVSDERAELDRQRKEFILQQESERKSLELANERFAEESEVLKLQRENESKKLQLEDERIKTLQKELQDEKERLQTLLNFKQNNLFKKEIIFKKMKDFGKQKLPLEMRVLI